MKIGDIIQGGDLELKLCIIPYFYYYFLGETDPNTQTRNVYQAARCRKLWINK